MLQQIDVGHCQQKGSKNVIFIFLYLAGFNTLYKKIQTVPSAGLYGILSGDKYKNMTAGRQLCWAHRIVLVMDSVPSICVSPGALERILLLSRKGESGGDQEAR